MKVLAFETKREASKHAFEMIKEAMADNAKVFGLATGSTPEDLYDEMIKSDVDFSEMTSVNLDEYFGLSGDHDQSYRYFMNDRLFNHKPFKNTYVPNGMNEDPADEARRYDQVIADNPIDLQILGIGGNAHIGFNEPGSSFEETTRLVDLTPETIEANKRFFDSAEDVPKKAYSMGIKSILASKQIILLAFGAEKAQAVKDAVEGPVTEDVPASVLQTHPNVTFILDKEAASLLEDRFIDNK